MHTKVASMILLSTTKARILFVPHVAIVASRGPEATIRRCPSLHGFRLSSLERVRDKLGICPPLLVDLVCVVIMEGFQS